MHLKSKRGDRCGDIFFNGEPFPWHATNVRTGQVNGYIEYLVTSTPSPDGTRYAVYSKRGNILRRKVRGRVQVKDPVRGRPCK